MPKVGEAIKSLDRYPATPSFYFNGIKNKQTLIGGLIGLLIIILTLIMIISKSINVFNRSYIVLDSFIKKDESKVKINGYEVTFVLFYYFNNSVSIVPYNFYPLFGIQVGVVEVQLNYTDKNNGSGNIQFYPFEPCVSSTILCSPSIIYQPECSYDNMDFEVCNYVKEYHIIVTNTSAAKPTLDGLYPTLLVFDTKYNLFEKKSIDIIKKMPIAINKVPNAYGMGLEYRYLYNVPISKLELHTEESVMPSAIPLLGSPNYTEAYFYPNDKLGLDSNNETFFLDLLPTYFDFYLYRSGFTQTYKRSYPRLDSMLGEIFGLVGLISLVFLFFCAGYNEWLMRIHVQDSLKNQQSNIIVGIEREKHYGIFLKEKFRQVRQKVKSFRKKQNNQVLQRMDEESQAKKDLDVIHMYHKIQKMQKEINILKEKTK